VALLLTLACCESGIAAETKPASELRFGGVVYLHRWSQNAQNEFTPRGEEDLARWHDMLTINLHDRVRDGDQLAAVANTVLGNYQAAGKVLTTDSKPRTPHHPAEHYAAAVLGDPKFLEAVFARFLLVEGRGVVVVYSHRVYGANAGPEMSAWLDQHGAATDKLLRDWTGMPSLDGLRALPQAAR
jgi:hypothetical protein